VDTADPVVGGRQLAERVVLGGVLEPLVDRHPLQAVGSAARLGADQPGQHERHEQGTDHEGPHAHPGAGHAAAPCTAGAGGRSAARCTRRDREASHAPTVSAVITPSPIPMRTWTPTMAPATVDTDAPPAPPIAYWATKPSEASTTDRPAATPAAATTDPGRAGSTARSARKAAQPPNTPMNDRLIALRPSALSPPSANTSACTTSTPVRHSDATHGPTSTAASAPPSRWPLVPLATGKLSICAANT